MSIAKEDVYAASIFLFQAVARSGLGGFALDSCLQLGPAQAVRGTEKKLQHPDLRNYPIRL